MDPSHPPPAVGILSLLPLFLFGVILALFIWRIARRKGRSGAFAFLGFVPFVNVLVAIWLASLTDQYVLDQIKAMKQPNA